MAASACALIAACAATPAGASSPEWTGATELALPANASPLFPDAVVSSVSCAAAGSCAAVGSYTDDSGAGRAMVAAQTGGAWSSPLELQLPANAHASSPDPSLLSVACGAPGSCSAVGEYSTTGGDVRAMVASRSGGAWSAGQAVGIAANPSSTYESLSAVSCGGAESCAAIGFYTDATGADRPIAATQSNGTWSDAVEIDLPLDADDTGGARLLSVACRGAGSCVAVGSYRDQTGAYRPIAITEANGTWSRAVAIDLPSAYATAPDAYLATVACTAAGSCVAGGSYRADTGAVRALLASLDGGSWSTEVADLPSDASASAPAASIDAIACGGVGSCGAVGTYSDADDTPRTMVASQIGGSWAPATRLAMPADADPAGVGAGTSVACGAPGACVLAASYIDSSIAQRSMVASQTDGSWSAASALAAPADAQANPDAVVASVTCGAAWSCTAGGFYTGTSGSRRAMLAAATPRQTAAPPPPAPTTTDTAVPVTTSTSKALRPALVVKTSRLAVSKGAIKLKLACRTARCSGTVKLTTRTKGKTIVLAKATYGMAAGKTKTVTVRLTKAGKKAFKHSRSRAVRAKLAISIKGGRTTSRTVAVR